MLKKIISLGVEKNQRNARKFRIRMINTIVLLTILLSSVYAVMHLLVGDSPIVAIALFFYLIIATLTLLSNHYKKFQVTEFALHFIFPIWVVTTSLLIGKDYQMESYLLLSGLGSLFIFANPRRGYYFLAWSVLLFISTKVYFIFHPDSLVPLTGKALPLLYILNGIAPLAAVGILMDNTFKHNVKLYRKLKEVSSNQEKIIEERTREVKEKAKALSLSNQELKRFSYISAHDLREPLRNIMSFSQLLERDVNANQFDNIKEYLMFINQGINRIDNLTKDIVSYTELEDHIPNTELVNTEEIVNSLYEDLGKAKEVINLKTENLPIVKINAEMCELLFSNLLENAIQYCDKSTPSIHISAISKGYFYEFSVQDNGNGIPKEYYETIFEMFKRLHNDTDKSGSGIGLAICKKIVTANGGKIWVESVEGAGSTFYFTLPVQ